jgi:hypothetical protein
MNRRRLTNRNAAGNLRREISDDFKYDKKKLKHLKHILHNINVSLGTLISALNEFSKIKGPDVSPDGMLGGLGYIMPVREMKEFLNNSVKSLSDVADSLADELTNPAWKAEDDKDVKELIKEKEKVEEKVEEMDIVPEDVTTSKEVIEKTEIEPEIKLSKLSIKSFENSVKEALLRFNQSGTR